MINNPVIFLLDRVSFVSKIFCVSNFVFMPIYVRGNDDNLVLKCDFSFLKVLSCNQRIPISPICNGNTIWQVNISDIKNLFTANLIL